MTSLETSQILEYMGLPQVFFLRVINTQLDQQAVGAFSISAFKGKLRRIRETSMGFFVFMD